MLFASRKLSDSWSSYAAPIRSAIKGSSKISQVSHNFSNPHLGLLQNYDNVPKMS